MSYLSIPELSHMFLYRFWIGLSLYGVISVFYSRLGLGRISGIRQEKAGYPAISGKACRISGKKTDPAQPYFRLL